MGQSFCWSGLFWSTISAGNFRRGSQKKETNRAAILWIKKAYKAFYFIFSYAPKPAINNKQRIL